MGKVSRKKVEQMTNLSRTTAGQFLKFIEHFNKLMPILDKRIVDLEATMEVVVKTLNIKKPEEIREILDEPEQPDVDKVIKEYDTAGEAAKEIV